jgi:hypothetical protein
MDLKKLARDADKVCERLSDSEAFAGDDAIPAVAEEAVAMIRQLVAALGVCSGNEQYYAVTGRIPGDDEDSIYVVRAVSRGTAIDAFEEALWEYELDREARQEELEREVGRHTFINSVVVSDTPIKEL